MDWKAFFAWESGWLPAKKKQDPGRALAAIFIADRLRNVFSKKKKRSVAVRTGNKNVIEVGADVHTPWVIEARGAIRFIC
jgi:hypothetical protein